jgi:hypothetical protein
MLLLVLQGAAVVGRRKWLALLDLSSAHPSAF